MFYFKVVVDNITLDSDLLSFGWYLGVWLLDQITQALNIVSNYYLVISLSNSMSLCSQFYFLLSSILYFLNIFKFSSLFLLGIF